MRSSGWLRTKTSTLSLLNILFLYREEILSSGCREVLLMTKLDKIKDALIKWDEDTVSHLAKEILETWVCERNFR
jgi:hypothetical protein